MINGNVWLLLRRFAGLVVNSQNPPLHLQFFFSLEFFFCLKSVVLLYSKVVVKDLEKPTSKKCALLSGLLSSFLSFCKQLIIEFKFVSVCACVILKHSSSCCLLLLFVFFPLKFTFTLSLTLLLGSFVEASSSPNPFKVQQSAHTAEECTAVTEAGHELRWKW